MMRVPARVFLVAIAIPLLFNGMMVSTPGQATGRGLRQVLPASCWSVVSSPNTSLGNNELYGIAAISPVDIWAVGSSFNSFQSSYTLIQHWDGTSWNLVPSPNSATQSNELRGVTAISSSDVWAVGDSWTGSYYQTLVEHWNGTSWSIIPSPNPSTSSVYLIGVTAISPSDIWAVGSYISGNPSQSLIEHWNGTSWSIVPSPDPGTTDNELFGVTAISSSNVWAVGYSNSGVRGMADQTLTEHWNGTIWSVVSSPDHGTSDVLSAVTAISSNDIWAVGNFISGSFNTLVEHWDGSSWSIIPSSNPGTVENVLLAVTAISSSDVWVVGYYISSNGGQSLTEHWDGTSWNVVPSPNPGADGNPLYGVAAISSSDVWTVGYSANPDIHNTLVEHYSAAGCNTPTPTPAITYTPGLTDTPAPTHTPQPTVCPNPFVDISGNIFFVAINTLYCRGDVNGTDATHYSPAGTSTRGQFAKVVALGFGLPLYTPTSGQDFSDVPPAYFAYAYIESGFHAGILSGFDQAGCTAHGTIFPCYLPNIPITRGQLTKLVVNAAGYPLYTPSGGQTFTDVPPSNIFYSSIETAHYKGLINGYPDGTFRPGSLIRRDEMAQIVYKGVTTPLAPNPSAQVQAASSTSEVASLVSTPGRWVR